MIVAAIGAISLGAGMISWYLLNRSASTKSNIGHGQIAFDISPSGDTVVFSAGDGDIYALDLQTHGVLKVTDTNEMETTPRFHPKGVGIVFAREMPEKDGSSIFASAMDGANARQLTRDPYVFDSSPAYSADGSKIVFARAHRHRPYSLGGETWDKWDIYLLMNSDGSELQRITRQDYYILQSPNFSIDGQRVVYSASAIQSSAGDTLSTLFEVGTSGREPPNIAPNDEPMLGRHAIWAAEPRLSADGSRIAFISDRQSPFHYDILISSPDGARPVAIGVAKTVSKYNQSPVFSADGQGILFLASRTFGAGNRPVLSLWRVDTNGSNPRCIANSRILCAAASNQAARSAAPN